MANFGCIFSLPIRKVYAAAWNYVKPSPHCRRSKRFPVRESSRPADGSRAVRVLARLKALDVTYFPTPGMDPPGEINHNDGGRGVYFYDPTGNTMELITVPYGGWPSAST